MPTATMLKSSTYRRMPWKNGGGETVEIAVRPDAAALSEFDWRISMATVATDGAFSIFPGIDRTLSILDGQGMSLAIDGAASAALTQESAPLPFAADVPVTAVLADGPITDLNVMTRRSVLKHHVERLHVDGHSIAEVDAQIWLLLCHGGAVVLDWDGEKAELNKGDTLLLEGAAGKVVTIDGKATCYLIAIHAL